MPLLLVAARMSRVHIAQLEPASQVLEVDDNTAQMQALGHVHGDRLMVLHLFRSGNSDLLFY
jgi:hypothetical protein